MSEGLGSVTAVRIYLATFRRRSRWRPDGRSAEFDPALLSALPIRPGDVEATASWQRGRVNLTVLTNEPEAERDQPMLVAGRRHAATWSGYLSSGLPARFTPEAIASLGGIFALVRCEPSSITGWTSVHRMEPLYVAETDDVVVLSNSARLAAHAIGQVHTEPSSAVVLSLASAGFMLTDETPYRGVYAVPASCALHISAGGVRVQPLPPADVDPHAPPAEHGQILADVLAETVVEVQAMWSDVVAHATGGKDSRLVLAALGAAGLSVPTVSVGFSESPDSIIGGRVARAVGFPHSVREPAVDGNTLRLDVRRRCHGALRGAEGMLSAYETVSVESARYTTRRVQIGGHGGELLRGGWAHGMQDPTTASAVRRFLSAVARLEKLDVLTSDGKEATRLLVRQHVERIEQEGLSGLDSIYREYRSGRWHAVARTAYSARGPRPSVLADNRIVRLVAAMPMEQRYTELVMYYAMKRLFPPLVDLPFWKARWAFEEMGPVPGDDREQWQRRAPVEATTPRATFNARLAWPQEIRHHFREVLTEPVAEIDALINRQAIVDNLDHHSENTSLGRVAWSTYTATQLSLGLGDAIVPPPPQPFAIPVPPTGE